MILYTINCCRPPIVICILWALADIGHFQFTSIWCENDENTVNWAAQEITHKEKRSSCRFKIALLSVQTALWILSNLFYTLLTLSDPTSDLILQYDFPVLLWRRKTSDTVFVEFVRHLSESVRRFSSCSTDFSQQMAQIVLFLFLHVFLF
jgi:hypothetical protein